MLTLRKIAITGGLSCGKSTVCLFLKDLGAYVVNADNIVHQLLSSDTNIGKQAVHLLGPDIYTKDQIDRKKIARLVFSDRVKLKALEAILHPAVEKEIIRQYEKVKNDSSYIFFAAELPLLYETGMEKLFDAVVNVSADPDVALSRYVQATGLHPKDFEARMNYQKKTSEKQTKANFVIVNNGDLATLKHNVVTIVQQLKEHFSE
jgi:dephospho-CoA kinase